MYNYGIVGKEGDKMEKGMKKLVAVSLGVIVIVAVLFIQNTDTIHSIKKEYIGKVEQDLKENGLVNYLKDEKLTVVDVVRKEYEDIFSPVNFNFVLEGNLTDEFETLTEEEKYNILDSNINHLGNKYGCGKDKLSTSCKTTLLTLTSDSDTYEFNSYSFTKNGEYYEVKTEEETETKEAFTPTDNNYVSDQDIYDYMKTQYERLTNYGANYVPEIHDLQVSNMAASKFGISVSEADRIYIDMEMKNAGY